MSTLAIVPSAGVGKRLGSRRHKSFVLLNRKPLLYWTLQAVSGCGAVDGIIVVTHRRDLSATERLVARHRFKKVIRVVPGGPTRTDSVFCGVQAAPKSARWFLVHDGARPLVTPQVLARTLRAARKSGAAIAAVRVVPTIKEADGLRVKKTLDRSRLWAVQTPQAFRRSLLERAHRQARSKGIKATDDAALVEALGHRVQIAIGDPRNIKVTTPEDLLVARIFLRNASRHRV